VEKTSSIRLQLVILRLREEEEDIQNIIFRWTKKVEDYLWVQERHIPSNKKHGTHLCPKWRNETVTVTITLIVTRRKICSHDSKYVATDGKEIQEKVDGRLQSCCPV
jgi:hypothetical protein